MVGIASIVTVATEGGLLSFHLHNSESDVDTVARALITREISVLLAESP